MSWRDDYRSKLCTAEDAVAPIGPGARLYLGGNAATPRVLAAALLDRARFVEGISVGHVLLLGDDPFPPELAAGRIRHHAWFVGPADRDAVNAGTSDYVPCHLSDIPRHIRAGHPPLDCALLMVSPPDQHGLMSLGVEVLASLAAAEAAGRVVVQVNPRMPRVAGNAYLHVNEVDAIVEAEEELVELILPDPDEVEQRIARHIVRLIPDEATLQLGIGGVPNAVVQLLEGHKDLGVHTEMISDGVMRAVMAGTINGTKKSRQRRKVVTTFILGSRALYDWVHENPWVEAHPCDYTNDLFVASSNDKLVAINSAISVDLTGQVNSDSLGGRVYSGFGGQLDFIRAAARSKGGVPIIALPATALGGKASRIVPQLKPGAGVVTTRADVHWVVTEYGAANLYGKTLVERREALIAIAHPAHRDGLREAAARMARGLPPQEGAPLNPGDKLTPAAPPAELPAETSAGAPAAPRG
jgi:acyl-CoA hydrolase